MLRSHLLLRTPLLCAQVLTAVCGVVEAGNARAALRLLELFPKAATLLLGREAPEGERFARVVGWVVGGAGMVQPHRLGVEAWGSLYGFPGTPACCWAGMRP